MLDALVRRVTNGALRFLIQKVHFGMVIMHQIGNRFLGVVVEYCSIEYVYFKRISITSYFH